MPKTRYSTHQTLRYKLTQAKEAAKFLHYQSRASIAAAIPTRGPAYNYKEQEIQIPADLFNINELALQLRNQKTLAIVAADGSRDAFGKDTLKWSHEIKTLENKHKYQNEIFSRKDAERLRELRKLYATDLAAKLRNCSIIVEPKQVMPPGLSHQNKIIWESKRYKQVPVITALHAVPTVETKPSFK